MEVTSSTSRKIRKPLMEKKRRARINESLEELRRLMAETASKESEKVKSAKLEKADILELAVKHVQYLHDRLGLSEQENSQERKIQERQEEGPDRKGKKSFLDRESVRVTRLPSGEVALIISTRSSSCPSRELNTLPRLMWRPW